MLTSIAIEPIELEVDAAVRVFAALADPARLRILALLADSDRCVCDIRTEIPIAANLLSYHLRALREAGLIEGRRRGRWIDYQLSHEAGPLIAGAIGATGFGVAVDEPAGNATACEVPRWP